jgi:hypothetical protein
MEAPEGCPQQVYTIMKEVSQRNFYGPDPGSSFDFFIKQENLDRIYKDYGVADPSGSAS